MTEQNAFKWSIEGWFYMNLVKNILDCSSNLLETGRRTDLYMDDPFCPWSIAFYLRENVE